MALVCLNCVWGSSWSKLNSTELGMASQVIKSELKLSQLAV